MNNSTLKMSNRIRRTPFTTKVEEFGVTGFTVVNHMLLPKGFKKTVEEDYWHLREHVQIWDVSCQRQVQITGKDSELLVQKMTPRIIKNMKVNQCLYVPIIDENAGMLNDSVLLKLGNNKFWLSVADSDVLLWAKGLAIGFNLDVKVEEPNVFPLAIQGPKSEELMTLLFGEKIKSIKFFHFELFNIFGRDNVIARSGYSNQDGFEIYFNSFNDGAKLWEHIWEAGNKLNISPGSPNLIDRIEAGLISYGNDFNRENNPYECNFDNYCKLENSHDFIGKTSLEKIKIKGVSKKIRGIIFDGTPCAACEQPFPVYSTNEIKIGEITSGIFSPRLKKNIGLSMILKEYWDINNEIIVVTPDNIKRSGIITSIPFK